MHSQSELMDQVLGYLNFSTGVVDPSFIKTMDQLFLSAGACVKSLRELHEKQSLRRAGFSNGKVSPEFDDFVEKVRDALLIRLEHLKGQSSAFRDTTQAEAALNIVLGRLFHDYRDHHRDLLFHQSDWALFNSFFTARAFEAVLAQGGPWDEVDRIVVGAIHQLNDFIGHRPVATLESQKIEPYPNEWVRPIPIFIADAGVACGPYRELVTIALETLRETNPHILRAAHFDPERVKELALDPRAFDFDHPINRRPNHHFGQWDLHSISQDGHFERFILHQVTLDSLLDRIDRVLAEQFGLDLKTQAEWEFDETMEALRRELVFEAAGVLAGTMLMASGICGRGPGAHDSTISLGTLLPIIAEYRDEFYHELMGKVTTEHRSRLLDEAATRMQPFGGVRQDLNAQLSKKRASQLVNCRLAEIFARMGYHDAAEEQSEVVPVASSRILCQIDCLLSSANHLLLNHGKKKPSKAADGVDPLETVLEKIPAVFTLLKRGIQCGAIVDPWNILGFDGNYSLFPAIENSITDHRVFELSDLIERIMALCSCVWSEAAAEDKTELCGRVKKEFRTIADWWRKYAAHEVGSIEALDPDEIFSAAELVAKALNLWHKGGAEAGDIAFWAGHANLFDSPKAYALVIDGLMRRPDYSTSMALLIHWLGQADMVGLQQAGSSFHVLVQRWIREQKELLTSANHADREAIWKRIQKFYDYLEANAEHYWNVPKFELDRRPHRQQEDPNASHPENDTPYEELDDLEDDFEDSSEEENIYGAAYEDVVYTDTTNDGFEGEIYDPSVNNNDELEAEVDRVMDRLDFLGTVANYWRIAATISLPQIDGATPSDEICARLNQRRDIFTQWVNQALQHREQLIDLLDAVHRYRLPGASADQESMLQYDRNRLLKESLLDLAISTMVSMENAVRMLRAVIHAADVIRNPSDESTHKNAPQMVRLFAGVLLRKPEWVAAEFDEALEDLRKQPLLYVPLSKDGDPAKIVEARVVQSTMMDLMANLPSLGMITATHRLTCEALAMERNNSIGSGAVTEFDELFQVAYSSAVHSLVESTHGLKAQLKKEGVQSPHNIKRECESVLFDCIEMLTEAFLVPWLEHSKTLRLTVLEQVRHEEPWNDFVDFIRRYGDGIFTQQFLHLANVRAILHQGVDQWLDQLQQLPNPPDLRLLDELGKGLPKTKAVRYLTMLLEAVFENYNYYRDYNTTTTQSDQGSLTYILMDFLRLRGRYERVCWNLKPVVWAHEILVRDQENSVAKMWRRSLTERVSSEADKYLNLLENLRKKYSVQMVSIGRRLEERFGHPMQIDRLRALVAPAMSDPSKKKSRRTFELLHSETQAFIRSTMGVGMDLPGWLAALDNEVNKAVEPERVDEKRYLDELVEPIAFPIAELRKQLEALPRTHNSASPRTSK